VRQVRVGQQFDAAAEKMPPGKVLASTPSSEEIT